MEDDAEGHRSLDRAWDSALADLRAEEEDLVVLFSGGVDSSLIAWELRNRPGVRLLTAGTRGSPDLAAAEEVARQIGMPWSAAIVGPVDVREAAREVQESVGPLGRTDLSVQTAFSLAVGRAPSGSLVCGQGVDELFLGYAHFRGLGEAPALRRSEADLEKLVEVDWPRSQRIAALHRRNVRAPYLDDRFVAAARAIPIAWRLPVPNPKAYFRAWAVHRGLPQALAQRPKRALQFGSGVERALRNGGRNG